MFRWFENKINPFPGEEPGRPPTGLMAFVWHYSKPVWPALLLLAGLSAVIAVLEVVLFGFLGSIVDWLSSADKATFLQQEYVTLIIMGVVVLLILPLFETVHSLLAHQTIIGNYPMIIRWLAHRYLLGQSMEFYQNEFAGRIATKLMQAALGIREAVMKLLDVLVYVVVYLAGALVLVATFDWKLVLPFLVWLGLYSLMLSWFLPRIRVITEKQADARSLMTGRIVDSYTNISTVKLFAHSRRETGYARQSMELFLDTVHPQMRLVTLLHMTLTGLNQSLLFSVAAIGIWSWLGDAATVGAVAVAIGLVLRLHGMSHWIVWETSALFENIGMAIDGMNTVAQQQSIRDRSDAKPIAPVSGEIRFDHVRFHYGKENGVIEDLSLAVKPGQKIGLVGRSGAGKSTIVNLLLRFYDVESGRILIDGQDISSVTQDSLRAQIGMVTQDTSLLHRSVRDNILYGRPDASEEMMIDAAKRAEAHEFILDLSDADGRTGYDAHVGERGVKLSGGQRQRIAIARVMLKDAPILILDEATSALDSEVEAAIQENLYRLMEGKTVIAIAHRLSTIAALDHLVVLDKGQIVEQGNHETLVAEDGLYASLWKRQSGGFLFRDVTDSKEETEAAE